MRIALILLVLAAPGCGRRTPADGSSTAAASDSAARAQALIEAGNNAYRTGDFGLAARRYAAAAVVKRDDAAAYYGLGMALSKLGRDEEARVAYARARELAQQQRQQPQPQ